MSISNINLIRIINIHSRSITRTATKPNTKCIMDIYVTMSSTTSSPYITVNIIMGSHKILCPQGSAVEFPLQQRTYAPVNRHCLRLRLCVYTLFLMPYLGACSPPCLPLSFGNLAYDPVMPQVFPNKNVIAC